MGTHEHSRVHFSILSFRTPKQGGPKGLKQPHEKKGGDLEIGTWPRLKCTLYEQNLVSQNQPQFSRFPEGKQSLEQPHEKNGPALLQNVASTAVGTHGHHGLEQAHEKNGPALLQNVAPTPVGTHEHSRVHFLIRAPRDGVYSLGKRFKAATRKERPCFAAECGLDRRGHTGTPDGLEQAHEKNGPVLLQNVAPTPLGTHEHSRVHFFARGLRGCGLGYDLTYKITKEALFSVIELTCKWM